MHATHFITSDIIVITPYYTKCYFTSSHLWLSLADDLKIGTSVPHLPTQMATTIQALLLRLSALLRSCATGDSDVLSSASQPPAGLIIVDGDDDASGRNASGPPFSYLLSNSSEGHCMSPDEVERVFVAMARLGVPAPTSLMEVWSDLKAKG